MVREGVWISVMRKEHKCLTVSAEGSEVHSLSSVWSRVLGGMAGADAWQED